MEFSLIVLSIMAYIFIIFNIIFTCNTIWFCKNKEPSLLKSAALFFFISFSIIISISRYFEIFISYSNAILLYYISLFFTAKAFLKTKVVRVIFVCAFYILTDSLFCTLVAMIFRYIQNQYLYNDAIIYVSSLIFNLLCVSMMYLCRKRVLFKNLHNNISLIPVHMYIFLLTIIFFTGGLAASHLVVFSNPEVNRFLPQFFTVISVLVLVITTMVLLINCVSRNYYENISYILNRQFKKQIEHYKQLEELNSDLRGFKHDYKNHMLCIKSMIEQQGNEDALEYMENLTATFNEKQRKFDTGNYIADSLFSEKSIICEKKGISFEHKGVILQDCIEDIDICIILSNILDNAIDACEKIDDGTKKIKIVTDFKLNCLYIKATNTVSGFVDIQKDFIHSTKSDKANHGFGLINVKRAVDKYNGELKMLCKDGLFTTEIILHTSQLKQ